MRKVAIIVVIIFCIPYLADAKNIRREYDKMIRKYDIDLATKEADDIGEFWEMVWKTNSRYMKFYKACQKEKPTAKRTFREYNRAYYLTEMYEESLTVINGLDSLLEDIKEDIGVSSQYNQPKFYVVDNPQFNAFSYPDGNIYIQSGILDVNGLTYWGLVGICVHEYAHYLLQHALAGQYYAIRREKASMAVAGIAAGLNTGAAAYASANGGRVDDGVLNDTNEHLLHDLQLIDVDTGQLTRAAVLLFHSNPEMYVYGAYIKIGFFIDNKGNLEFQDEIHGPLMEQVDKAMDLIKTKYLIYSISYEGISRRETPQFPIEALRESLMNAIAHKDLQIG